jgi:predicted nucleic acid-binding protein
MAERAYLDTCTLYSIAVTDTCLRLAHAKLVEPKWSADVLEELNRNLVAKVGLTSDKAAARIRAMQRAFPDAEVTGYERLTASMTCDAKDRHVLAAAIHSGSSDLVTFNLKDFPLHSTKPYDIRVVHPDKFLLEQLAKSPRAVLQVIQEQAASKRHPPMSSRELLENLGKAGVPQFAAEAHRQVGPSERTAGVAPAADAVRKQSSASQARRLHGRSGSARDLGR